MNVLKKTDIRELSLLLSVVEDGGTIHPSLYPCHRYNLADCFVAQFNQAADVECMDCKAGGAVNTDTVTHVRRHARVAIPIGLLKIALQGSRDAPSCGPQPKSLRS